MRKPVIAEMLSKLRVAGWCAFPVVLALVASCSADLLFPVANQHDAAWKGQHGVQVQQAGGADKAKVENGMTCNICHTSEKSPDGLVAHSRGSSKSCFDCHQEGYLTDTPHPKPYLHGAFIKEAGGYLKATVDGRSCAACHTTEKAADGAIPLSPRGADVKSCFSCHAGPTGFN